MGQVIQSHQGHPRKSMVAASVTAFLVFALTYLAAWSGLRYAVIQSGLPTRLNMMRMGIWSTRNDLSEFARKHGRYPDSLDELGRAQIMSVDAWNQPYSYSKYDGGYQLLSLGRDGKPGGEGLDADMNSADMDAENPYAYLMPQPTLHQFLIEGQFSATLFWVAFGVGIFSGLLLYFVLVLGGLGPFMQGSWSWFLSVAITTLLGVGVSGVLMLFFLARAADR